MGYDIPGVRADPNAIVSLTAPILKGVVDIRGSISVDEVVQTATPADVNLIAGLAAGAITTGLVKYWESELTIPNGTAQTTALFTVPKGSILLNVMTLCTEAFNGDTTKTFEVGVTGNTDKYIDPVDCVVTVDGVMSMTTGTNNDQKLAEPLGAATALIATWTNTATATTGKMKVKVVYC